jgi:hypothetical protein
LTSYWRARLDWHTALSCAQDRGIADADRLPPADNESRMALVDTWRAALVKQLLTPRARCRGSRMEAGTTPRGKPPLYGREARADRARDCRRRCVPRGTPDAPFYRRVAPVFKAGAQMKRRRRFRKRNRQRLASHRRRLGR